MVMQGQPGGRRRRLAAAFAALGLVSLIAACSSGGAGDLKANYADWAWKQVSDGDKVYAIPVDAGPMGLLYRQDLFAKYHLKVPATWDEFKQQAQALKAANPKALITDFGTNDAGFM